VDVSGRNEVSLDGLRVLVVEDDAPVREAVTSFLEHYGAAVTPVASVAAAMLAIEREPPDVLLADLSMPDEDGYSLIRRVRALPPDRGGRTPAAAFTAHTRPEDQARVLQAGFQFHLSKPVDGDHLLAVVALLGHKE
jgi:hypothetical protein